MSATQPCVPNQPVSLITLSRSDQVHAFVGQVFLYLSISKWRFGSFIRPHSAGLCRNAMTSLCFASSIACARSRHPNHAPVGFNGTTSLTFSWRSLYSEPYYHRFFKDSARPSGTIQPRAQRLELILCSPLFPKTALTYP